MIIYGDPRNDTTLVIACIDFYSSMLVNNKQMQIFVALWTYRCKIILLLHLSIEALCLRVIGLTQRCCFIGFPMKVPCAASSIFIFKTAGAKFWEEYCYSAKNKYVYQDCLLFSKLRNLKLSSKRPRQSYITLPLGFLCSTDNEIPNKAITNSSLHLLPHTASLVQFIWVYIGESESHQFIFCIPRLKGKKLEPLVTLVVVLDLSLQYNPYNIYNCDPREVPSFQQFSMVYMHTIQCMSRFVLLINLARLV